MDGYSTAELAFGDQVFAGLRRDEDKLIEHLVKVLDENGGDIVRAFRAELPYLVAAAAESPPSAPLMTGLYFGLLLAEQTRASR